jgi:hypothetical protein
VRPVERADHRQVEMLRVFLSLHAPDRFPAASVTVLEQAIEVVGRVDRFLDEPGAGRLALQLLMWLYPGSQQLKVTKSEVGK